MRVSGRDQHHGKEERKDGRREERLEGSKEDRKEGRQEGRKEGRKEARKDGRKRGSKEGSKEGSKKARKQGRKEARKEGSKGRRERKEGREAGRQARPGPTRHTCRHAGIQAGKQTRITGRTCTQHSTTPSHLADVHKQLQILLRLARLDHKPRLRVYKRDVIALLGLHLGDIIFVLFAVLGVAQLLCVLDKQLAEVFVFESVAKGFELL
jgi:hypothetical protein